MEIELNSVNDLQKLCRLCMGMGSEMYSIYDLTPLNEIGRHIQFVEMIMECSSLIVESGDGLPEAVCVECLEYLRNAYTFKLRCEKSDISLRQLIDIFNGTKTDIDESDCIETLDDDVDVKDNLLYIKYDETNDAKDFVLKNEDGESISDGKVICTYCSEEFTSEFNLKVHEQYCDNKIFTCDICSENFSDETLLTKHLTSEHSLVNSQKEYVCGICDDVFADHSKLLFHFKMHIDVGTYFQTISDDKILICYYCNADFTRAFDLETHIALHKAESNKENYACRVCDYNNSDHHLVKEHLKMHGVGPFICNLCLMSFTASRKFRLHLKSHYNHTPKDNYNCSVCKHTVSREDLKTHLKSHANLLHTCTGCSKSYLTLSEIESHQNDHLNSNLCPICGKLFARKSRLTSHMVYHDSATPHKCSYCDKSFRTKAICKKHEDIHNNDKPFICTWCGYTTKRTGDLNIHIRIHTGVKPYNCTLPGCDRTFTTSSQRNEHIRRHTGERNHICHLCNKSFLESKTLKIHMLVHSGVRPHKCDICGKYFRRKHHLVVHKVKLHGD